MFLGYTDPLGQLRKTGRNASQKGDAAAWAIPYLAGSLQKGSAATEAAAAVPGFLMKPRDCKGPQLRNPKGPSTQIVGFQGPKTIQSMDFGT